MAEAKTRPGGPTVADFIAGIADPGRRQDARTLVTLMRRVTGEAPRMVGPSIVGFGQYHYRYASGREGDSMLAGFSPRASGLVIYAMAGFARVQLLLSRLGKHKTAVACLYLKRLADVDLAVLEEIVAQSVQDTRARDVPASNNKAAATKPAVTKPAVTKPAVTKPAVKRPAVKKPAVKKPAVKKPAVTKPAVTKPAVKKPAVKKPAVKKPAVTKPRLAK